MTRGTNRIGSEGTDLNRAVKPRQPIRSNASSTQRTVDFGAPHVEWVDTPKQTEANIHTNIAEILATRHSMDNFTKTLEASIAKCSECVYTARESLDTITSDVTTMALEIDTIMDTLKAFQLEYNKSMTSLQEGIQKQKAISSNRSILKHHVKEFDSQNKKSGSQKLAETLKREYSNPKNSDIKCSNTPFLPPLNPKPKVLKKLPSPSAELMKDSKNGSSKLSHIRQIAKTRTMNSKKEILKDCETKHVNVHKAADIQFRSPKKNFTNNNSAALKRNLKKSIGQVSRAIDTGQECFNMMSVPRANDSNNSSKAYENQTEPNIFGCGKSLAGFRKSDQFRSITGRR